MRRLARNSLGGWIAGLDSFYREARFLVVPSVWFETFGLVAAEAMAHGLPVIASRIGGLPEVVEHGVSGLLVNPGDSDDLARAMRLLWENPSLCRQMGEAARRRAIQQFSDDIYYERLMAVYQTARQIVNRQGHNGTPPMADTARNIRKKK